MQCLMVLLREVIRFTHFNVDGKPEIEPAKMLEVSGPACHEIPASLFVRHIFFYIFTFEADREVEDGAVDTAYSERAVLHTFGNEDHSAFCEYELFILYPEFNFSLKVMRVLRITAEKADDLVGVMYMAYIEMCLR